MRGKTLTRYAVACLASGALAVGLLACGDEDAQTLTFTLSGRGRAVEIAAPDSADTGLAEITLENNVSREGDLQLIRAEGDHSADEVVQSLGRAMKGQAFPDWFFAGGGVGPTAPGASQTVTQVLEPGTYYAFDTSGGPPDPRTAVAIEVNGESSDDEISGPDATVSAVDYGFEAEGLTEGTTEIVFENIGAQPHHLIASPLIGDATAEDVERFFKTEKGKPPLSERGTQSTAVVEGSESQLVTLDLKPGRYVFYCFISDRQGGPPHALKGMVDEFAVE
ncbi:MAG TPA: hypothetical protein VNM89_08790 [Solirubrobacterales bacterium]|nr:hypothetical protein [Solirubrobacterales bacterium]